MILEYLGVNFDDEIDIHEGNVFYYKKCKGIYTAGKFIILAGSVIHQISNEKFQSVGSSNKLYDEQISKLNILKSTIENLHKTGKIKQLNDREYELLFDFECNSPSLAACYAVGHYAVNG
jgi:hypothetical protein